MFLISRTGWTKNGIYKGQTLVQWGRGGCCTATLDPLLQVLHGHFLKFFDNNVCNRKRCTYLKGLFKTSSKSQIIKLLVNSRSNTPHPHLPVDHWWKLSESIYSTFYILILQMNNHLVVNALFDKIKSSLMGFLDRRRFHAWDTKYCAFFISIKMSNKISINKM